MTLEQELIDDTIAIGVDWIAIDRGDPNALADAMELLFKRFPPNREAPELPEDFHMLAFLRIKELEAHAARLQATVDFFRAALPWALRKSHEVENFLVPGGPRGDGPDR
jgi:hypothetical protein